ncbi:SLBB domain-containing protein [Candidatus Zixiibacteriota bacterium]
MGRRTCMFLLLVLIIILYCISWRPALCEVVDTAAAEAVTALEAPEQQPPETLVENFHNADPALAGLRDTNLRRSLPRPDDPDPQPFGYDVFGDQAPGFASTDQLVAPEDYILGPGDQVLLNAWGRVDMSLDLTVDREGKVFIPRAGEVVVRGLTVRQAQDRIHTAMADVYSNFELSLMLGRLRSMTVYVFGETRRPGAYTVSSLSTVFNALYQAGGPNARGSLRNIRLLRGNRVIEEIDFYDFLLSGRRGTDPRLQPGDVVFVPVVGPRVTIRGEVKRPGIYEIKNDERLSSLFALAGEVTAEAYLERIMIDRIAERDGRRLLDIDYTRTTPGDSNDAVLVDGDDVSVFSIFEIRPNVVWLEGAVRRPGAFERFDSMTVYNLIGGGSRLAPGAYTDRADLERTGEDGKVRLIPINLKRLCDGEGELDVLLTDKDRLIVYDRTKIMRRPQVHIDGLVKRPGAYELLGSMRLSDLIFRAGNLKRNAYLVHAEIARYRPSGPPELITINLQDVVVRHDLTQDIILEEDDRVFIRQNPEGYSFPTVNITGEVKFPGNYALSGPAESLYGLITRAGWLTARAFPEGTIFIRRQISEDLRRQGLAHVLLQSQPIIRDSTGGYSRQELLEFDPERMTRIVLDVPSLLKNRGGEEDIILQDGDGIYIPAIPSGVQLMGAVASPGTIMHHPGWKVSSYLQEAGGLTPVSNQSELRLIRANGQVISGKSVKGRRVHIGDAIFVPPKIEKEKDWLKYVTTATSVITSMATTWLIVDTIGH